jgi:hypothetical protein
VVIRTESKSVSHAGSKLAATELFFPIRICLKPRSWTVSSGDPINFVLLLDYASAGSKPTNDNLFNLNTAAFNIYSWMISSVEPADDAVFMPSWFTHEQFLECSLPMVLAKWLAESKSVSLGLRGFETYR